MSTTTWSGRAAQTARAHMARQLPCPCARCGRTLTHTDRWVVGHIKARATRPELTHVPSNWQVECRPCSDASSQAAVQQRAQLDGWIAAGRDKADFPHHTTTAEPPARPRSLSEGPAGSIVVPDRLVWSEERLRAYDWLRPLVAVPGDAAPPLAMTPVHPSATASYGAEACAWIEKTQRIRLRWWQRLAITRQLEHDAAGRLVWRTVVESASRRSGKSVRVRGVALWRLTFGPDLFGERQEVVHTGSDLAVCRKVQKEAWQWSAGQGLIVTKGNGKEAIETRAGDTWLVRAQAATYGWDTTLALIDEGWDVKPDTVSEGLEPSLMERQSSQLHLTSTAHRRATSLMRSRIGDALAVDDGETLLLLWAAPAGADPGDPETWRAASPHWSEDRRRMLAARYAKALAGDVDPEADDLDPMAGFEAQYLNRWILKPAGAVVGSPVVSDADWAGLESDVGGGAPDAVAVEGWPGQGISVAMAWRDQDAVVVSVDDTPDVATAAALVREAGCRRPAIVGASLATDPAWRGVRVTASSGAIRATVADLSRMLTDGILRHDGAAFLTGQVLGLRTSPGVDGLRLRSAGRADAVKAAVWAAREARRRSVGKPRIITAA